MNLLEYKNYLVDWIRISVKSANMKGVIVGISGGIDSALVASLAKEAFPNDSLGILMPENEDIHYQHGLEVAKKLDIKFQTVNIKESFLALKNQLNINDKLAIANIKPRLRMTTLYAIAQEKKYLVLGTDNFAEWILGYFTKYGDGGVDLLPIVQLFKSQVYEMAKIYDVPSSILDKQPTAGLWGNQTDEDELGFRYSDLEEYVLGNKVSKEIEEKIIRQINITSHKRSELPTPNPYKKDLLKWKL